jgi:hypothetical protein
VSRFTFEMPAEQAAPSQGGRYTFEMPEQRSTADAVGRQVGLTARHGINAAAGAVGVLSDPIAATINLLTGSDIPFARQLADDLMTRAGLPQPENRTERIAGAVTEGMAGAGTMVGSGKALSQVASPAAKVVGDALSAGPGMQVLAGAGGAGNAARVREDGGSTADQVLAGLTGAAVPLVGQAVGSAAVRGAFRGGEANRLIMDDRISTIEGAGAQPTVGLGTGTRLSQAVEAGLAKLPGSAGPIARAAQRVSDDLGDRVSGVAEGVARNADPSAAGAAIERGVTSFVKRFRGEQQFLYNKLDQYIPAQQPIDVSNTRAALRSLTADIPGAPELSSLLRNPRIASIAEAFSKDAANSGPLPYAAIKQIRTEVGNAMSEGPLVSGAPTAKLKELYGALSRDMEAAATAAGPDAEKALARANQYTRAGMQRIETHLDRTIGKTAEETYKRLVSDPGNTTKLATTLKSLDPAERDIVKASVINRLGRATAGQQDEAGEVFSASTFLTNWNKLEPRGKAVLFSGQDGQLRRDLDQVAKTAAMLRDQSRVFANPSGTAAGMYNVGAIGASTYGVLSGNLGTTATLLTAMGAANLTGRMMTNPDFVRWLARSTRMPPAALPTSLNTLSQVAAQQDSASRAEIESFIRAAAGSAR